MKNNEQDLLLAEMVVKLSAIERLLTKAGVIKSEELTIEMKKITEEVISFIKSNSDKILGTDN